MTKRRRQEIARRRRKMKRCRNKKGQFTKCPASSRGATITAYKVHFDGVHCRDGDGKYVPVAECRPMTGKTPFGGKKR